MLHSLTKFNLFLLILSPLIGQVSSGGEPKSISADLSGEIPIIVLPAVDKDALLQEDDIEMAKDVPYRFGTPFEVQYNLENSGLWEELPEGRIWRLSIHSEDAFSINLLYDRFVLPEGAELYIYDEEMTTVLGAFTHLNNKPHQTFSTSPTKGEFSILEYFEPFDVEFQGEIQINRVVHAYREVFFKDGRDYGDSGSCNNNVNCPEFVDWEAEVRSVAMILSSGGWRLCTGALVNNARQDLTPYFLTANHCLGGESSWIFMFQYESSGCSNQDGPTYMTVQGATLLDNASTSDYALLRLDDTPPESYEIHFAGWSAQDTPPVNPVGIHHPSGDIKKITFDDDTGISDGWSGNDGSHWRVADWEDGTTEPGSSGSPLFDNNHRIVGQLHGGEANCSWNVNDYYGKVSTSWNLGLSNYLDPDNTGITVLDGMDAIDLPDPELSFNAGDLNFELGSDETGSESFTISNTGEADSELNYTVNTSPFENVGGGPDDGSYFWTDSDTDDDVNYSWIDISVDNFMVNFADNDDSEGPFDIGFEFPFYGSSYNQLTINPNGWIGFGISSDAWDNTGIPSSAISGPAIFALWDDLNPENDNCNEYCSGNVYTHANADRMVIWFNEVAHWWTNFENSFYDFQVILYPSGKVDMNYRNITGTYSASVGIQGNSSTGTQVIYNADDLADNFGITYKASPDWLTVSPESGMLLDGESQSITVTVDSYGLTEGSYDAYLRVVSSGGSLSLPVMLEVGGSILGDLNDDLVVNVLDVIIMVNMILGTEPESSAADLNNDGEINILDIVQLVNIILEG